MCFINRTTRRRVPPVVLALVPNTYIETLATGKPGPGREHCWNNSSWRTPGCN